MEQAEADLADLHSSFMADASIHKAEVAELEAALAERDTRRCEMCGHWGKHEMWPDQGWCPQHNEMDADCSCSEWTARAEEGSRNE